MTAPGAIRAAIAELAEGRDLSAETMGAAMREIMGGEATPAQIGAFLVALRIKGETVTEIAAAAQVMRELATPVPVPAALRAHLVDVVGTGGDAGGLFNVSTASAFVVAAAGGRVAKHGNRAVSGRSGAADLLEAAGASLGITPQQAAQLLEELGVAFLFAPTYHAAMRHAIGPRRELGLRTMFNLLGPLTNPAGARRLLLGVFDARWLAPLAQVMGELGAEHVLVVCSEDGLDEISLAAPTRYAELRDGQVRSGTLTPEDLGVARSALDALRAADPQQSLALVRQALSGQGAPADLVALNAGAAIHVAGLAPSLSDGVARAREILASGEALVLLDRYASRSRELAP